MRTILIVDDTQFSRAIIRNIIKEKGYQTIEAANGSQALEMFEKQKPDLVTMDLLLPDIDGMDVARKIKEINPAAKIVICSADKQKSRQDEAVESNIDAFVPKPINSEALLSKITALLE